MIANAGHSDYKIRVVRELSPYRAALPCHVLNEWPGGDPPRIEPRLAEALEDSPVVLIHGLRQYGKLAECVIIILLH